MADRLPLAELKIPARRELIPVAKMVIASLGSQLGFNLEELDEIKIAVAQACESTIEEAEGFGPVLTEGASLQLVCTPTEGGLAVDVGVVGCRIPTRRTPMVPNSRTVSALVAAERALARDMIRLFVDDFRHQVDNRRGEVHLRMVKYVVR
ncbi:MAG: hypothetical protein ACREN8_07255 [Candidatus Dormibacteraceae bacterium]